MSTRTFEFRLCNAATVLPTPAAMNFGGFPTLTPENWASTTPKPQGTPGSGSTCFVGLLAKQPLSGGNAQERAFPLQRVEGDVHGDHQF